MSTGISTPVSAASLRPLTLAAGKQEHTLLVPGVLYTNVTQLRDQFVKSLDPETEFPQEAVLVSEFLEFIGCLIEDEPGPFDEVLPLVLSDFEHRYLVGNDVHSFAANLELDDPDSMVRAYYRARQTANRPIRPHASALLRAAEDGTASVAAIFGGQGTSDTYFTELRKLYNTYPGVLTKFISDSSRLLRDLWKFHPEASKVYSEGFNVISWLDNSETCPDDSYLVSAPVSVPVIGLIQLSHYLVTCAVLGLTPNDFLSHLVGVTGHSQGIVTALAVSGCTSWEDFHDSAAKALTVLFYVGLHCQTVYPDTSLLPSVVKDSVENNEGNPSPMLSVKDIPREYLQKFIDETNSFLPEDRHIVISLVNGPRSFVVSGPPMSLYGLNRSLRHTKDVDEANQGRIPFSQRKLRISNRFLPITSPFHSYLLKPATERILKDISRSNAFFSLDKIAIPVYDTYTGDDLRTATSDEDLGRRLVSLITELPVAWEKATMFKGSTHILDFGPGGSSGMAQLTHRNKEGTGVRVIVAGLLNGQPLSDELGYKQELFDRSASSVVYASNWVQSFSPKLVKTSAGRIFVDTKFSRLLGRPHVMVPGMVPATAPASVVAATLNAGYHIELGGGAYFMPEQLKASLDYIHENTAPSVGISLNVLYVNPMLLQWCIPLVEKLRKEGFPIEGLTIGAGVPSLEVANEYINNLGLKHISFKPGTVESLRAAVQIAAHNPNFPVIIQWTGGRGGGHHSFEDFHQPILSTYGQIRKHPNIILIAGSGFGDDEGTYPYLTGEWSTKFDYPPMPFDGFLMGSRCLVAKEFKTAPAVKQAIVDAKGVSDSEWEGTYKKPTGGIITVLSEMGEPIHKLATRGVMLWKELDDTIFSLPRAKRLPELLKRKDKLIRQINSDFQKPWFGLKHDGSFADIEDMTYVEVLNRLIDLMFVEAEKRWIDISLKRMFANFVRRVEERFTNEKNHASILQNMSQLDTPYAFLDQFLEAFPCANAQIVNAQDKDYFLLLCLDKAKKPVPFIPIIDENFEFYFKKDSLWQSEDLAAVMDHDVGRTCILQGPVAVRYSKIVDEPIKDILDGVHDGHVRRLLQDLYENDESKIPVTEMFGGVPPPGYADIEYRYPSLTILEDENKLVYTIDRAGDAPEEKEWLDALAGDKCSWRYSLISSDRIVQGQMHMPNAIRRVLKPIPGLRVEMENHKEPYKTVISVYEPSPGGSRLPLVAKMYLEKGVIIVKLREYRTFTNEPVDLELKYIYDPTVGYAPISEVVEDRNERIKYFYWQVWFGSSTLPNIATENLQSSWEEGPVRIERTAIKNFVHAVTNKGEAYADLPNKLMSAPMDFAIVVGWKAIIKAIFPEVIDGDLLKLVHLSNGFKMLPGATPLMEGDMISTVARINSVVINPSGKVIEVLGRLIRDGEAVMEVKSQFLYRGKFEDYSTSFSVREEVPMQITLNSPKDVAILQSKEWFHAASDEDLLGKTLTFRCTSTIHYKNEKVFSQVKTVGQVVHVLPTKEVSQVGEVYYTTGESFGNPVVDYLNRMGKSVEQPVAFDRAISLTKEPLFSRAPASNDLYAQVSGDYNPIHLSRVFANYVGLPGTITHGMFSSASIRAQVEVWAAENYIQRFRAFECSFVGMVLPNDVLETKLEHVGMINGRKIIEVKTVKRDSQEPVLLGKAEVEQPTTAYMFTGQGSQEQGMGMSLYDSSEVAREVWDRADRHFINTYGISILEIVRNNPLELTVHFGGTRGKEIRENYISMMFETVDPETGDLVKERIFKTIDHNTDHYTFKSPNGVLSMTQFTQPALTLMEKASFEDIKSRGLVVEDCMFAGHSLGEYSALAALADVMPVESLVDVVFYRGMTMQVAVPRDSRGRSNYGMVAINPSRVSPTFSEEALKLVVDEVSRVTTWLLEIVNYNVSNQQYVAAGDLRALDTVSNVLNVIKLQKINIERLQESMSVEEVKEHLAEIIKEVSAKSVEKPQPIELERGFASIPLPGISVPFHSSYLRSGVNPFKMFLAKRIHKNAVKPASLVNKYIPNLTAKPFTVTKEYFEEVFKLTKSPDIKSILDKWDEITAD